MKSLIALAAILISANQAYATDSKLCKNEALKAAYERFTYEFPEAVVSVKTKGKAIVDQGTVSYSVELIDLETGEKNLMGVILEQKSCQVIAVN